MVMILIVDFWKEMLRQQLVPQQLVALEGDTIKIRPGRYVENNPIGLRTDVSITGEDIRLVTIEPQNVEKDVFWVRRGCLIENLNFSGATIGVAHTDCGAVAFPITGQTANSGYTLVDRQLKVHLEGGDLLM